MAGPAAPAPIESWIVSAAAAAGIPADLLREQLRAESGFSTTAVSSAGAVGIAQFMPSTAAGMGLDPTDPQASIYAAAKLDAANLQTFGGDVAKAIAAYNAGAGAVQAAGGVPNYPETQSYVAQVMAASGISGTLTASTSATGWPNWLTPKGLAGDVVGALPNWLTPGGLASDAAGAIAGAVVDLLWGAARPVVFAGVFAAAGVALVGVGVYRMARAQTTGRPA